jgi:mono/diheme cytochrome c family protein
MLQISVPMPPAVSTDPENRARNMQLAAGDRQAVFKGDCIRCHVTPTIGQMGQPLYGAACGICHDAAHRNAMVPDLRMLPHPTNHDFWKAMIVAGKPNTLMPGFSADVGGPLTRAQIDSLADYLTQEISPHHPAAGAPSTPAPAQSR